MYFVPLSVSFFLPPVSDTSRQQHFGNISATGLLRPLGDLNQLSSGLRGRTAFVTRDRPRVIHRTLWPHCLSRRICLGVFLVVLGAGATAEKLLHTVGIPFHVGVILVVLGTGATAEKLLPTVGIPCGSWGVSMHALHYTRGLQSSTRGGHGIRPSDGCPKAAGLQFPGVWVVGLSATGFAQERA